MAIGQETMKNKPKARHSNQPEEYLDRLQEAFPHFLPMLLRLKSPGRLEASQLPPSLHEGYPECEEPPRERPAY